MINAKISRCNKKTKAFTYYGSENQPIIPKLKISNCQEQQISRDLRIAHLVPLHDETTLDPQRALTSCWGAGEAREAGAAAAGGSFDLQLQISGRVTGQTAPSAPSVPLLIFITCVEEGRSRGRRDGGGERRGHQTGTQAVPETGLT